MSPESFLGSKCRKQYCTLSLASAVPLTSNVDARFLVLHLATPHNIIQVIQESSLVHKCNHSTLFGCEGWGGVGEAELVRPEQGV